MKILMIGGTGIISTAVTELLVTQGYDVTLVHRNGRVPNVRNILCPVEQLSEHLGNETFDVAINWICYTPEDMTRDLAQFTGRVAQYIFISSTVVYDRPTQPLLVREDAPHVTRGWPYAMQKSACERMLQEQCLLPYTIVRPSHTYGRGKLPAPMAQTKQYWSIADRLLRRKPFIVPGDGTSVWTLTHSTDFARGLLPLLGNKQALWQDYHLTSSEWLTWRQILDITAKALGVEAITVPMCSVEIEQQLPQYQYTLTCDKAFSALFDNSKRLALNASADAVIPFAEGIRRELAYYDAHPECRTVDNAYNAALDSLL
ncbi:MAG: NAD-dependent epimerase/dehydratase family protein [Oscillospiraceae bacterium]|nr:NAD-dependent epimerase/dehydratase family protein [Oscillospiraceae bacterium]